MSSTHSIDKLIKYAIDNPIDQIHEQSLDIKSNHIYLFGEESYVKAFEDGSEPGVEYTMANRFIKNLNILMRYSSDPILIHMKTCGGDWEEGMAIYDAIKACPNPITILNYTHARSMSSLIFLAANKRVMMPHSTFMFHLGSSVIEGTHTQVQTEAKQQKAIEKTMLSIYAKALLRADFKKTIKACNTWLLQEMRKKEEVYLSAKDAVLHGFADEVFGLNGVYDWSSLTEYTDEQLES